MNETLTTCLSTTCRFPLLVEVDFATFIHFDNLSFNLAHRGFTAAKYVPYGPLREAIPYLIRRAEENTSVGGQTSRELSLIRAELERRRSA